MPFRFKTHDSGLGTHSPFRNLGALTGLGNPIPPLRNPNPPPEGNILDFTNFGRNPNPPIEGNILDFTDWRPEETKEEEPSLMELVGVSEPNPPVEEVMTQMPAMSQMPMFGGNEVPTLPIQRNPSPEITDAEEFQFPTRRQIPFPERENRPAWQRALLGGAEALSGVAPGTYADKSFNDAIQRWMVESQLEEQRYGDEVSRLGAEQQARSNALDEFVRLQELEQGATDVDTRRMSAVGNILGDEADRTQRENQFTQRLEQMGLDRENAMNIARLAAQSRVQAAGLRRGTDEESLPEPANDDDIRYNYGLASQAFQNDPESLDILNRMFDNDGNLNVDALSGGTSSSFLGFDLPFGGEFTEEELPLAAQIFSMLVTKPQR